MSNINSEKIKKKIEKKLKKYGYTFPSSNVTQDNTGSQVNNGILVGDMHFGGITVQQLADYIEPKLNDLNTKLTAAVDVLISDVVRIITDTYHNSLLVADSKEVELTIKDIVCKQKDLIEEIKNISENCNNLKDIKEANKQLKEYLSHIESEIKNLFRLCEDILYSVRLAYKLCSDNNVGIKANGELIKEVKEFITSYIRSAEIRYEQIYFAIQTSVQANKEQTGSVPSYLDMSVIAEMFGVIKKIKEKQDAGEDIKEYISLTINDINAQNEQVLTDIKLLQENSRASIDKANEIIALGKDTNHVVKDTNDVVKKTDRGVEELNIKVEILTKEVESYKKQYQVNSEIEGVQNTIFDQNLQGKKLEEAQEKIKELQKQKEALDDEVAKFSSNGEKSLSPCPNCFTKEARYVINGYCECSICGHCFENISPNIYNKIDEEIEKDLEPWKKDDQWRKDHHALLEQVSENIGGKKFNLYRMKLDKNTVSNAGALIIPFETYDKKPVSKIAFCQPNTDDKAGQERLSKVKTLIFEAGLEKELCDGFDGKYPFSINGIPNLTKVMKWDKTTFGYIEDLETLGRLKSEGKTNA